MKILAFTDIHGKSLKLLEEVVSELDPDRIFCLGDYDEVSTLHKLMEMKEKNDMIVLPGNHEHSIYHGEGITSGAMRQRGNEAASLHDQLRSDREAEAFVKQLLENHKYSLYLDEENYGEDFHTLLIHAGLAGSLHSNPGAEGKEAELWYRLQFHDDHRDNFEAMREEGYNVMIRGHDAAPQLAFMERDEVVLRQGIKSYELKPDRVQCITLGDYFEGHYAVIETGEGNPVVEFKEL